MKRNILLLVFVVILAITNAQMFSQFDMDFNNFPSVNSMKKNSDSFGFNSFSSNNNINIPSQFQQSVNRPGMANSLNSQSYQTQQGFQNLQQPSQNTQTYQNVQPSQQFSTSQNVQPSQQFSTSQNIQTSQNVQLSQQLPTSQQFSTSQSFQTSQPTQTIQTMQASQPVTISQPMQVLPTIAQIQKMINDNKVSDLISLIQKVKKSSMKCDAKSAYITDILAKIQISIDVKSISNKLLDSNIQNAQANTNKLNNDNLGLQKQQVQLNIPTLKNNFEQLVVQAKNAEASFKACNFKKQSQDLLSLKQKASDLTKKAGDLSKTKILNQNQLKNVDSEIKLLEEQLANLKNAKNIRQNNIAALQNQLLNVQGEREIVGDSIAFTENKINEIIKTCNNLKKVSDDLNFSVNSLAENIRSSEDKFRVLSNNINSNIDQTKRLKIFAENCQNKIIFNGKVIDTINVNLKDLREAALSTSYVCNNAINFSFVTDNINEIALRFGLMTLSSYLKKSYNYNLLNPNEIYIKPLSIFTKSFSDKYGFCLSNEVKNAAQKDSNSYTFDSDFSCYNTLNNLVSKKGTIKSINKKFIEVNGDDGMIYKLILGSCTRIQGVGAKTLPQIDNKITWKGAFGTDGYFLHAAAIL